MDPLRIALVSSEVTPFAKTGGLADVSAALARHLGRRGHDVQLIMPMYARIREKGWDLKPHPTLQDVPLDLGGERFHFSVSTVRLPQSDVHVTLIRCPRLYEREGLYTQDADEHLRFAVLSLAAIQVCQWLQWSPDVFHCNDWHTALLPLYLKAAFDWDELFQGTKTVLTLHNLGYQGVFSTDVLPSLGLEEHKGFLYQEDLEQGRINYLKTGLLYADVLTTVSETYAREIQTEEHGVGLDGLLRARADNLVGIVNGVDYGDWDPATDPHLSTHYSAAEPEGKQEVKRALLKTLELEPGDDAPLMGIVSRLTPQKGFDLLPDVLPVLLQERDVRLVALGSGEESYERFFDWLQETYPDKVCYYRGYNDELAHLIEAASDLFLMPSRYEPCGLNQMYSLRYGTAPVVRRTGGLADTVEAYDADQGTGTGFVFDDYDSNALYATLEQALEVYADREAWAALMQRGMTRDFSWEKQVQRYEELYAKLLV